MEESLRKLLMTPYVVAIFFAILWCIVCYFASFVSGWYSLSKRFRAQSEPYGEMKTAGPFFYTVYMRFWGHYSSIIRMMAAADALYLSVLFLFRSVIRRCGFHGMRSSSAEQRTFSSRMWCSL